jgi:hypothetical protein
MWNTVYRLPFTVYDLHHFNDFNGCNDLPFTAHRLPEAMPLTLGKFQDLLKFVIILVF